MKFIAVQCFSCSIMQVKQVKKSSNKWSCTICNEKQSVRKVFATSDAAKDVRGFVQKFNLSRGLDAEVEAIGNLQTVSEIPESSFDNQDEEPEALVTVGHTRAKDSSKWQQYLSQEEQFRSELTSEQTSDDEKFVTSLPDPHRRKRNSSYSCQRSSPVRQQKTVHSLKAPREDPKVKKFLSGGKKDLSSYSSRSNHSLQLRQGRDVGSDNSPQQCQTWNLSPESGIPSSALPPSDSEHSPKRAKSGNFTLPNPILHFSRTELAAPKTSKWSEYLT